MTGRTGNKVVGRFHLVTGSREENGGWWFETHNGRYYQVEIAKHLPDPPVERLLDVEFAEDGTTVWGWEE